MTNKKIEEIKKEKEQPIVLQQTKNAEFVQVGELVLSSDSIRADELLGLSIGALKNKNIKKYLGIIDKKKLAGLYR